MDLRSRILQLPVEVVFHHIFPHLAPTQVQELCKMSPFKKPFLETFTSVLAENFHPFDLAKFIKILMGEEKDIFRAMIHQYCSETGKSLHELYLKDIRWMMNGLPAERGLLMACYYGLVSEVSVVLKNFEALPNLGLGLGAWKESALRCAARFGHHTTVEVLLQDPRRDPSANHSDALRWAVQNGHYTIVALSLNDSRVDPTTTNNYPLRRAAQNGHDAIVALLLKDPRVDPTVKKNYALRRAAQNGHCSIVDLLLKDPRVDPSAGDNAALRWAVKHRYSRLFDLLLKDPRVDPSADNNYVLRKALKRGDKELIQKLLLDRRVTRMWTE